MKQSGDQGITTVGKGSARIELLSTMLPVGRKRLKRAIAMYCVSRGEDNIFCLCR